MSKLSIKPNVGYTKPQDDAVPGNYPNTIVEAIYWDKEKMTLEEALRNGGGGSSDVQTEMPEGGFAPNTFYNLGTITENTAFLMAEGEEGKANHYFWVFETGADVPEITWPEGIRLWKDNKAPVIAANHHYEISVYDGVALYIAIEMLDSRLSMPLTIEATQDGTTVYFRQSSYAVDDGLDPLKVEVSTDEGATWTEVTAAPAGNEDPGRKSRSSDPGEGSGSGEGIRPGATLVSLDAGDKVLIRGNNSAYGYYSDNEDEPMDYCNFWSDQPCYVYGNIMSLVSSDDFASLSEVDPWAFCYFFSDYDKELDWSWVLANESNELLLPATTLANSCYIDMFRNCTSLTAAPALPATTLAYSCYRSMFAGCTSLTTAPDLPAVALVQECYNGMFFGCTNLAYIKALFTTVPGLDYTHGWAVAVMATGTFVKSSAATWDVTGPDGVPSGWTVQTE